MEGYSLPPIVEVGNEFEGFDNVGMMARPAATASHEAVFGWYPPQWNVYAKPNYKQLDGYDKECLYKNMYNAFKGAPAPPVIGRPPKSPPARQDSAPVRRSMPSFRLTRPMSTNNSKNSGQLLKRQLHQNEAERRLKAQELRVDTRDSPRSPEHARLLLTKTPDQLMSNSWHFDKPSDYVIRPMEGPDKIPKPCLKDYGFKYGTPASSLAPSPEPQETNRPRSAASPSTRPKIMSCRPVRSATVRRPKFPSVPDMEKFKRDLQRSTASATPVPSEASSVSPSPSTTDTAIPETQLLTSRSSKSANRIRSAPATSRSQTGRPETPTPNREAPNADVADESWVLVERPLTARPETAEPVEEKEDSELTYDELVDRYGWKVQIPGDPLNLKKNIIRERVSFTVSCSVPEPAKDPPKVHRQVWDTYFLNTIPRKPATFTIAPDWVSEVLHAKRMELQKREGINYRYKDFAFVY